MINSKAELREWLDYELAKYSRGGGVLYCLQIGEHAILRKHQILLRKAEYFTNTGRKLLGLYYKTRLIKIQTKYGLNIPLNTCDKGLRIMHLGSILINRKSRIGKDCTFHINTAVVSGGVNTGVPKIGNNVIVGVGATIVGDVTIADYVAIGAGAVVTKSILEKSIAVGGIPAKRISDNGSLEWNKKNLK